MIKSSLLFFILILLFAVANPLLPPPNNSTTPQFAVCSIADVLMTFSDQNKVIKDYLCHSA